MPYPTEVMRNRIDGFYWNWNENNSFINYEWCVCDFLNAALNSKTGFPDHDNVCKLFWSFWIDQIIEKVANENNKAEVYKDFRSKYNFPKIKTFLEVQNPAPHELLTFLEERYSKEDEIALLEYYKEDFWKEIAGYLKSIGEDELVKKVEQEFKNDLTERKFPEKYHILWKE